MVTIQFYNEVHPALEGFIRHYWYVHGEEEKETIQKLLPMDHVDMIMNMGHPFLYGEDDLMYQPDQMHFHGIREHAIKITQPGRIQAMGISFKPWGFYFFGKQTMNHYVNRIANLKEVNDSLWQEISKCMLQWQEPITFIESLEKVLINDLHVKKLEQIDSSIIEAFINVNTSNIKNYCDDHDLSLRRLERIFRKYIGVSPKRFMNIVRFEESARDVMYSTESNLTDISYKHGYYDQPHFVKAFKSYTTYAPREFQADQPALKSHLHYDK